MPYGYQRRFNPNASILAGLPRSTLEQYLAAAQNAYNLLMTGGRVVTVGYGDKSVTYTQAEVGNLTSYIQLLQAQLGYCNDRKALRPIFR